MIPIQELLNRIRWDEEFGAGYFEIGYEDHVVQTIIRVPLQHLHFEQGNHFAFQMQIPTGEMLTIPFHRVRAVYKDGVIIWSRTH